LFPSARPIFELIAEAYSDAFDEESREKTHFNCDDEMLVMELQPPGPGGVGDGDGAPQEHLPLLTQPPPPPYLTQLWQVLLQLVHLSAQPAPPPPLRQVQHLVPEHAEA
jgi:hypothetical protein